MITRTLPVPRRDGFGHVAFSVYDVEETCDALDKSGVKFQSHGLRKKPAVFACLFAKKHVFVLVFFWVKATEDIYDIYIYISILIIYTRIFISISVYSNIIYINILYIISWGSPSMPFMFLFVLAKLLRKKPNEGRMKGLAFALDPDGYWVEILRGGQKGRHHLAQTMLRVKDKKNIFWLNIARLLVLLLSLLFFIFEIGLK